MRMPLARFPEFRGRQGFTLVEVLLVLALLALVGAVLIPAANSLFPKPGGGSIEDTVAEALQQVRREAVVSGHEQTLKFDEKQALLVWGTGQSNALVPPGQKVMVDFVRVAGGSSVLIGGQLVETSTIPVVRFYPDGTCDPVRVQLRVGNGERHVLTIDPWTCAPGLEAKR